MRQNRKKFHEFQLSPPTFASQALLRPPPPYERAIARGGGAVLGYSAGLYMALGAWGWRRTPFSISRTASKWMAATTFTVISG